MLPEILQYHEELNAVKGRVMNILFGDPNNKLVNIHIDFGPKAESMTVLERYLAVEDILTCEKNPISAEELDRGLEAKDMRELLG